MSDEAKLIETACRILCARSGENPDEIIPAWWMHEYTPTGSGHFIGRKPTPHSALAWKQHESSVRKELHRRNVSAAVDSALEQQ